MATGECSSLVCFVSPFPLWSLPDLAWSKGSALTFLSFLIMSFATKLWQVFLTQGFLNGVCLGLTMPL